MSGHSPAPAGETETVTDLSNMPEQFCPAEDITAIECRPVGNQNIEEAIKVRHRPVRSGDVRLCSHMADPHSGCY